MLIPAATLVVGLLAVVFATERYGLRFGGVVVVPLLAVYILFDPGALPLFVISTATAYVSLVLVDRRIVLYGRQLLMMAIVTGALVPVTTFLLAEFAFGQTLPVRDVAYLGSILPGIAAYNLRRLDRDQQVADVVGSLTLVVGLVALAVFFLLARAVIPARALSPEVVFATVERTLLGRGSPVVAQPTPILPREYVVGLFVVGLVLNEYAQKRYGLRLAGIIAVALVAVFAVQDAWLLAPFLLATVVAAGFVWLIHTTTFLYGRNLLAGACIVGVVVAAAAAPFLPASVGIRPLIVGLLGGVTAYNSHVLAPTDRVPSIALTAGAFVGLFALAEGLAHLLARPVADPITATGVVVGLAVVATAGVALFEYERLRPREPIGTVADGGVPVVPDGGAIERAGDAVPDGGAADPLAGRRVVRIGPNARLVRRRPRPSAPGREDRRERH